MNKLVRHFSILLGTLFLSNFIVAQSWTMVDSDSGVELLASVEDCNNIPVLLISAKNNTAQSVRFDYTVVSITPGVVNATKTVDVLEPGTTLQNDCGLSSSGFTQHYFLLPDKSKFTVSDFNFEINL